MSLASPDEVVADVELNPISQDNLSIGGIGRLVMAANIVEDVNMIE